MITSIEQYQELASMADIAEESLNSLRFGSHAFLILKLRIEHEIRTDRLGAIKAARALCDEYLTALFAEEN